MNVTLKLPDDLIREARHRAVSDSKSLSAWLAELVRRELAAPESETGHPRSLFEGMAVPGMPEWFYEKELPLPDRKAEQERAFAFDPGNE